jgi:DNA-binding CsgD family transcriptional regulator
MVRVIVDSLQLPALQQIKDVPIVERKNTVIATPLTHPAYLTALSFTHVAAVVNLDDLDMAVEVVRNQRRLELPTKTLTPTEAAMLTGYLDGRDAADLAADNRISIKTVNAHLSNVLRKHNTRTTTALIAQIYRSAK